MAELHVPRLDLPFFAAKRRGSAGPPYVFDGEIHSVCPIEVLDLGIMIPQELLRRLLRQLSVNRREFWLWLRSL